MTGTAQMPETAGLPEMAQVSETAQMPETGETVQTAETTTPRTAVLFDFGGVLTGSLIGAFIAFGTELGDPRLPLRILGRDPEGSALLVAHEEGRIDQAEFEAGYAARLAAHGMHVEPDGLLRRLQSHIHPDPATIDLVARLRTAGVRVGLLSNSLGDDCYAGFDLAAMFDAVTISREIGVRKPSRRAYLIACEHLDVAPEQAVMVDDLEQNIAAAARIGIAGVVHRDASTTEAELRTLLRSTRFCESVPA